MDQAELSQTAAQLANDALVWVGFGCLVGLLAKAIMPGRDPGGAVTTILMGIGGSVIGCAMLMYFWHGQRVTPISPVGFLVATGGAFLLLLFYRLFAGYFFAEAEDGDRSPRYRRRRFRGRRRRDRAYQYDD